MIVETELKIAAGIDDRNHAACSLHHVAHLFASGTEMGERRSQRINDQDNEQDGIGEQPHAALPQRQSMSEQNVRHCRNEKVPANSEHRDDQETRCQSAQNSAEEIRRRKIAQRSSYASAIAPGFPKRG